jgi:hypothetical protein
VKNISLCNQFEKITIIIKKMSGFAPKRNKEIDNVPHLLGVSTRKEAVRALTAAPDPDPHDPVSVAMTKLTSQFYLSLVQDGLKMNPTEVNFQLMLGFAFPDTNELLWSPVFDPIPERSVANSYTAAPTNVLSGNYKTLLNKRADSSNSAQFKKDMGNAWFGNGKNGWYYWSTDPTNIPPADRLDTAKMMNYFRIWALGNYPDKISCLNEMAQTLNDPLLQAQMMMATAMANNVFGYNQTTDSLASALTGGKHGSTFSIESNTSSSDVSHTWAGGSVGIAYDFFSFKASASYDKLTVKTTSSNVSIQGSLQKWARVPVAALSQASVDPNVPLPWFSPGVFQDSIQPPHDATKWKGGESDYNGFFGPDGSTLRVLSEIVIADGITIITKTDATFTSDEQTEIRAAASVGFFPFFQAGGEGGSSTNVSFDADGHLTSTFMTEAGVPQIIGCIVNPTVK